MITPEQVKAIIEAIKNGDSQGALDLLEQILATAAGAPQEPDAGGGPTGDTGAAPSDSPLMSALAKALGTDAAGILTAVTQLRSKVDAAEAERAAIELGARRDLVGELVKLGAELPATAWEGEPKDRKPCARLMAEPIADLRSRVAALRAAKPAPKTNEPPEGRAADAPSIEDEVKKLSKAELAACKKAGVEPSEYVERKRTAVRRQGSE